jgi:hypothetical protein
MERNYLKEITIGIIVTVVGGLILAGILGNEKPAQDSIPSSNQNPISQPVSSQEDSPTIESIPTTRPTPRGITNPTNPVPAGTTILADDYALTATGQVRIYDYATVDRYIDVGDIVLQNFSDKDKVFSFQRSSFTLKDDLGNTYTPSDLGRHSDTSYYYDVVSINIRAQKSVTLESHDGKWIEERFPSFYGPIAVNAQKLYLIIDGFGPFPYLEIEIDL